MVGAKIQEILTKKGLTQDDLAKGIGMSLGQVNRIINGKAAPTLTSLEKILNFLDVPIEALYADNPRHATLAAKMLETLPDEIVEAIGDKNKINYLLLGLKLSDTKLTEEEIEFIVKQYETFKTRFGS